MNDAGFVVLRNGYGDKSNFLLMSALSDVIGSSHDHVDMLSIVLSIKGGKISPGDEVTYHGLKDVQFGIQVGNSIIVKGVKTEKFISKFYNIRKLERVPYPPSLYPMDFTGARAARIALGADKEGRPVEEIVEKSKERAGVVDVFFLPESMEFLKRGGRVSPAIAFLKIASSSVWISAE